MGYKLENNFITYHLHFASSENMDAYIGMGIFHMVFDKEYGVIWKLFWDYIK